MDGHEVGWETGWNGRLRGHGGFRDLAEQGLGEEWVSWGSGSISEKAWISFIAGSL